MYANKSDNSYAHSALELKISSANLYNFIEPPNAFYLSDQIYDHQQWQNKLAWLNHFIVNQQPDIIGFQEIFTPEALKNLMISLGYPFFAVVDKPENINQYTFKKPVVCLASRYPFTSVAPLIANSQVSLHLGLQENFRYTRAPLHACIDLPSLGPTDVYVVHLKSHRPMLDEFPPATSIHGMIRSEIIGNCHAITQRSAEASQLMIAIIERRFATNNPAILIGDFNDDLSEDALSAFNLTKLRSVTQYLTDLPISHYQLQDSWQLLTKKTKIKAPRLTTHYHNGEGSTLDYILLSSEFDSGDIHSIAEVTNFYCHDSHISNDTNKQMESSDHAIITAITSLRS